LDCQNGERPKRSRRGLFKTGGKTTFSDTKNAIRRSAPAQSQKTSLRHPLEPHPDTPSASNHIRYEISGLGVVLIVAPGFWGRILFVPVVVLVAFFEIWLAIFATRCQVEEG